MDRWHVVIEVWPGSSGKGRDADQAAAGDRTQSYYVDAEEISGALKLANCVVEGIVSNPAVWMAPIMGITRVKN